MANKHIEDYGTFLTIPDIAEILGVSKSTAREYMSVMLTNLENKGIATSRLGIGGERKRTCRVSKKHFCEHFGI